MKKYLILALFAIQFVSAQQKIDSLAATMGNNEVRVDVLSAIAASKLNLSYERYMSRDWSIGITLGYSDSDKVNEDFDKGYRNSRPEYDVTPFVRYKMSKGIRNFYFIEAFASANGGDYKETVRRIDPTGAGYYVNEKSTYFDVGAGAGVGYKMYFSDKFGVEFLVAFGTNFVNKDKSPDTLSRVGLSLAYRF
ncbi:MAG TPA: DUF3575 domain-containing protein [Flavobacterium sp.]|jgi:hypothetical protein